MRLKTLRKERPAFEIEGAVINGSHMDLSSSELRPTKHRSNTAFALPASLSSLNLSTSNQTQEMSTRCRPLLVIPVASQVTKTSPYQAIEAACLEHGIRVRLSPTKVAAVCQQQSGRKSMNSLQRNTAFINRNPSRTSSVLHYATTNQDQNDDSRSFSALQQISSNDFHQSHVHNVSYDQSVPVNEDYYAPSIIESEHSNPTTPPEKSPMASPRRSLTASFHDDPDLAYMSSLLKKPSGDTFRDTIRRRAGLRGTFAVHRHSLSANFSQQPRDKSPVMNQHSLMRNATVAIVPPVSPRKLDKDILKHASRIRTCQLKDFSTNSLRIASIPFATDNTKRSSINKPLKSMSLVPLQILLTPAPRIASLSVHDSPSAHTRHLKIPKKRVETGTVEIPNTQNFFLRERLHSSSILRDESLSLMKTSPLDMSGQVNSFDSGCFDHSSSGGDIQSLTSSSIIRIPSSIPSARLTSSTTRRSNTNKRVSFYDEPTAVILTTATYV